MGKTITTLGYIVFAGMAGVIGAAIGWLILQKATNVSPMEWAEYQIAMPLGFAALGAIGWMFLKEYIEKHNMPEELEIIDTREIAGTMNTERERIEVEFHDGTTEWKPVTVIASREEAYILCADLTKKALSERPTWAYYNLNHLHSGREFSDMRNYELEEYARFLTGKFHGIDVVCPFNGFKYYDEIE